MSLPGGHQPLSLMFLLGLGLASETINCPGRCSCQYLEVNCTGRQLQELPVTIPLDTRQLILAANKISYLPAVELSFLAALVYLDCRENLLGDDLDFPFTGGAKLVYLDLSFNNLTQVTFSTFSQLISLVVLKMSDNPNLVQIEKDAFANNTRLRYLDVSRTGLLFLDTSTVRDLPNLRVLGLSENLWHCNCSFLDFTAWMTKSNVHFPGEGCVSRTPLLPAPADLGGRERVFWSLPQKFGTLRTGEVRQHKLLLAHGAVPLHVNRKSNLLVLALNTDQSSSVHSVPQRITLAHTLRTEREASGSVTSS